MEWIKLSKIPSVMKNVPLPVGVDISSEIPAKVGSIVMVEAGDHEGKYNILDFVSGRLGYLWQGDKIPAVLGNRKAIVEFAGEVPASVSVGDRLYLLCESGIVGAISGVYESWGKPMKVKILGAVVDKHGYPLNLKEFRLSGVKKRGKPVPLIVFLGSRMDSGKTTMACKVSHNLKALGKKIAAVKLTGVAFSQDLMKLKDAGALPVYDFVDMGLPSTCNGNAKEVLQASLDLVNIVKKGNPDCILVEFGDAVLGEYHVSDILQNGEFKLQIKAVVLAANDFAGIKGTKDILEQWGIAIDLVTGPVANSRIGVELINKYFHLPAESNQHQIPKTMDIIYQKCFVTRMQATA